MASSLQDSRPARMWKALSEERRMAAATAFWADENAVAEQAEMLGIIARQINFRPKSVMTLPIERKARLLARNQQVSDIVAARLLVAYHLAHQRPMMKAFLDKLGMPHEDGLLNDDVKAPGADVMKAAVQQVMTEFPEDDARLYFTTLLLQDPQTWGGLEEALTSKE